MKSYEGVKHQINTPYYYVDHCLYMYNFDWSYNLRYAFSIFGSLHFTQWNTVEHSFNAVTISRLKYKFYYILGSEILEWFVWN